LARAGGLPICDTVPARMQGEQTELQRPGGYAAVDSRAFIVAFALCSLAALCVLWIPKYLPMTDLPQHAAQVSIWKHLNDPAYGFGDVFELQYFTPYLMGYGLARLFAEAFSVLVALKLVLTLAVLGLPLSLLRLLHATRGDRWWSLVGFPLAFGYPFLWGFFNYVVAIPLGVFYLAFVVDCARRFDTRRAVWLAVLTTLLLAAHLLIFALCGLSAAALLAFSAKTWRAALLRLAPLTPSLLLALAWGMRRDQNGAIVPDVFHYGLQRFVEAPALLVGYPHDTAGLLVGLLIVSFFVISGVRLVRGPERWIPLALWACAYLLLPRDFNNVGFLYPRLATLLVPFAFLATEPGRPRVRPPLIHAALTVIALGWTCVVFGGFYAFDRDARQLDVALQGMPGNQRIRSLIFDRGDEYTPGGVPFLHFPVWYQVEKGGTTSFSFACSSLTVAVSRSKNCRLVKTSIDWLPAAFDMRSEQDAYDYYIVRAPTDLGPRLFRGATRRIHLAAHEGMWWVYRRGEKRGPG
jgi:hypothetical protein